jgi:hypothetical protein
MVIWGRALRMCFGGKVEWRGTRYAYQSAVAWSAARCAGSPEQRASE